MNSLLSRTLRLFAILMFVLTFSAVAQAQITVTTTSLPQAQLNVAYFATLSATGGTAPYTWTVVAGALPPGLTLSGGAISGTPITITGSFTFTVQAADGTHSPGQRSLTIGVPPVITTASLPNGLINSAYSQTLSAVPTTATPMNWTSVGSLPPGVFITDRANGVIAGTPTVAGTFYFTVQVTDSASQSTTANLSITIEPLLTIPSATLPIAIAGASYAQQLAANGPPSPTWSLLSGLLPSGMSVSRSGSLAGTPGNSGTFNFAVSASSTNPPQTAQQSFTLVVNPALAITTSSLQGANLNSAYPSTQIVATGGRQPYTWLNVGAALPAGMSFSTSGVLSGTPTVLGNFTLTFQVSDTTDNVVPTQVATRSFVLTVSTTVTITTLSLPNPILNVPYNQQFQATGAAPFLWAVTSGALPAGLTLSSAGQLQGTPVATGPQTFTVGVTDLRGATGSMQYTLTVEPPIPALSTSLPSTLAPTQVSDVTLSLAAPLPTTRTGQLMMTFASNAEVPGDDPATQFSSGSRTVNFTFPANATSAVFPSPISLLTGTVAGTITLTANFDNGPSNVPVSSVTIPLTLPQMTSVAAVRTTTGIDVQIIGYATSRRVTSVEFTFDVKGESPKTLTKSVDMDFANWYKTPASIAFGSSFSFVQSFQVTGNTNSILDVTVRLINAQGSTSSGVVKLQ